MHVGVWESLGGIGGVRRRWLKLHSFRFEGGLWKVGKNEEDDKVSRKDSGILRCRRETLSPRRGRCLGKYYSLVRSCSESVTIHLHHLPWLGISKLHIPGNSKTL